MNVKFDFYYFLENYFYHFYLCELENFFIFALDFIVLSTLHLASLYFVSTSSLKKVLIVG